MAESSPGPGSEDARAASPSPLAEFVAEWRRRRVFRALVGYGIFAFAVLQVVEPVLHGLGLNDAWLRGLLVALGAGFPITALASWTFDLTRRGVHRTEAAPSAPLGLASRARAAALIGSAALGAVLATGAWLGVTHRQASDEAAARTGQPVTLAVLPLSNLSGDASQEYFSDGMTEEIIGKLSRLSGLAVTARSNVARFKGSAKGAREIGKELGVAYLLEGSVRRSGERIRISATLVKTADGFQVWSENIDAKLDDIFDAQERVATRIVEALHVRLSPDEAGSMGTWGTRNVAAYDEYLRGQVLVEHFHQTDKLEAARKHFERALEIDPRFAPAMAGLASAEAQTYRNVDSTPARLERAQALVARALAVDPRLVRALFASGEIRGVSYDYRGAAERFRQVTGLEPRNYLAWDYLCWALGYVTPPEVAEAEKACRRAIQINPAFGESYYHLARVLIPQGRFPEAERALGELAEHFPDSYLVRSGWFWLHLGADRPREALAVVEQDRQIMGTGLGRAWAAMALAQLGRLDEAFAEFDEGLAGGYRDLPDLRSNPYFEPLRRDPRFGRMLATHGIELGPAR